MAFAKRYTRPTILVLDRPCFRYEWRIVFGFFATPNASKRRNERRSAYDRNGFLNIVPFFDVFA